MGKFVSFFTDVRGSWLTQINCWKRGDHQTWNIQCNITRMSKSEHIRKKKQKNWEETEKNVSTFCYSVRNQTDGDQRRNKKNHLFISGTSKQRLHLACPSWSWSGSKHSCPTGAPRTCPFPCACANERNDATLTQKSQAQNSTTSPTKRKIEPWPITHLVTPL